MGGGDGFPVAAVFAVGVAVLGEVGPGGEHLLGEVPVTLRPGAPAVLQGLEHEPQVGGVERALEDVRAAVRGQRAGELVGPGLAAVLLAVEAEVRDDRFHVARVVEGVADHVGDVGQGAVDTGLIEAFREDVAVDVRGDGGGREDAALAGGAAVEGAHCEDGFGRGAAELLQVREAGPIGHLLGGGFGIGEGQGALLRHRAHAREHRLDGLAGIREAAGAHDDGLVEGALGERGGRQELRAAAAGALAEQHHVVRVAAELGDVGLDPLEGLDLVQGAPVAGRVLRVLRGELGMGEEAERAHAVVEGDEDDVLRRPLLAVELRLGAPAFAHAAAEHPHGHRELLLRLAGRLGPYVQIQTVLAIRRFRAVAPFGGVAAGVVRRLERRMAEGVAHADAFPRHDGLRRLPAVLADGRRGEGNATEYGDARDVGRHALDLPALDRQDGALGFLRARGHRQGAREDQDSFHIGRIRLWT